MKMCRMIKKVNLKTGFCYFCMKEAGLDSLDLLFAPRQNGLENHHIFFGVANRKISDKYGLEVDLCPHHHRTGATAVHQCKESDLELKRYAQREFEKLNSREDFIKLFGRNYL